MCRQAGFFSDAVQSAQLLGGLRGELVRELSHDTVGKRVGHFEDVIIDRIERAHVRSPVTGETGFLLHPLSSTDASYHRDQRWFRPVRIRFAQKVGDILSNFFPLRINGLKRRLILQKSRQLIRRGFTVVRWDGASNIVLVPEKTLGGGLLVRITPDRSDDVIARPNHVVCP